MKTLIVPLTFGLAIALVLVADGAWQTALAFVLLLLAGCGLPFILFGVPCFLYARVLDWRQNAKQREADRVRTQQEQIETQVRHFAQAKSRDELIRQSISATWLAEFKEPAEKSEFDRLLAHDLTHTS